MQAFETEPYIKVVKYGSNARYYITSPHEFCGYTNLQSIRDYIRRGYEVEVFYHDTGDNITREVFQKLLRNHYKELIEGMPTSEIVERVRGIA